MKLEYVPKGYKSQVWKRKWRDRIVNAVTVIIFLAVYIIAGQLEP